MAINDRRPRIELNKKERDRLIQRLDEMVSEAEDFRRGSQWNDDHAMYWRMYRAEPKTKIRNWPWPNASNLFIPLVKVAINATVAQEFEALLSNDPIVTPTEGSDKELSELLTDYYFGHFYKKIMPLQVWGTDWLTENAIDGTAALQISQMTDWAVRRWETSSEKPIYKDVPTIEMDGSTGTTQQLESIDYDWFEQTAIEQRNDTIVSPCDMSRVYMAPKSGSGIDSGRAFYGDSCPWYYRESFLTWDRLKMRERTLGYVLKTGDKKIKAFPYGDTTNAVDQVKDDTTTTDSNTPVLQWRILEFFMRWPLPMRYRKYNPDGSNEILNQSQGEEDGFEEEIVVTYCPEARMILLVRPLSRICPDGQRDLIGMHYRRIPRYIYGTGQCQELRDIQAGYNKSYNQMVDYGDLVNMPIGFYSPGATGLLPEIGSLEPGRMYEVMDPRGMSFASFPKMDGNFYFGNQNVLQGWAEKVSSITESLLGKSPSTPNAPRTARGQIMMVQMSHVQFSVLAALHAMSFAETFRRVHAFKKRWAPASESFRVLNKNTGIFESRQISDRAYQMNVDFDFQINPNRTQSQQVSQMLYSMTISSIQQAIANPMLQLQIRELLADVYRDLGRKNLDQIWPRDLVPNIIVQNMMNAMQNQGGQGSQPPVPGGNGGQPPMAPPPEGAPPMPQQLNMNVGM